MVDGYGNEKIDYYNNKINWKYLPWIYKQECNSCPCSKVGVNIELYYEALPLFPLIYNVEKNHGTIFVWHFLHAILHFYPFIFIYCICYYHLYCKCILQWAYTSFSYFMDMIQKGISADESCGCFLWLLPFLFWWRKTIEQESYIVNWDWSSIIFINNIRNIFREIWPSNYLNLKYQYLSLQDNLQFYLPRANAHKYLDPKTTSMPSINDIIELGILIFLW